MSDRTSELAGWQLDRSAPEAYERYLVPPIFAPWAEGLLDAAEVREGDRVLDVACGTGIVARRATSRVGDEGDVTGIDINDGMLAVAERADEAQPQIEWRQGDATDLPFADERFTVVCCQQALQFFDDPRGALVEMRRVLETDGRAALSVWRPLEYQPGSVVLAEALGRYVGEEAVAMMRSPFPDWDGDDLRRLARDVGFAELSVAVEVGSVRYPSVEEFVRREAASSPLAEAIAAVGRGVRADLVREVDDGLEGYTDDDGVVFPMESYVLAARR